MTVNNADFTGQVALVTGAGAGMGLATARAFAESGAAVALTDIDEAALNTAVKELTDSGHRPLALTCDVRDEAQVAAAVDRTVETFGRLDMAYNNAGIQIPRDRLGRAGHRPAVRRPSHPQPVAPARRSRNPGSPRTSGHPAEGPWEGTCSKRTISPPRPTTR